MRRADEDNLIAVPAQEIQQAQPYRGDGSSGDYLHRADVSIEAIEADVVGEAPAHISIATLVERGAAADTIRAQLAAAGISEIELPSPLGQNIMGHILAGLLDRRAEEEIRDASLQSEPVRIAANRVLTGKEAADRNAEERAMVWEAVRIARTREREEARIKAERAAQADAERIAQYKAEYNSPAAIQAREAALAREDQARNEKLDALNRVDIDVLNRAKEGAQAAAQSASFINNAVRIKNRRGVEMSILENDRALINAAFTKDLLKEEHAGVTRLEQTLNTKPSEARARVTGIHIAWFLKQDSYEPARLLRQAADAFIHESEVNVARVASLKSNYTKMPPAARAAELAQITADEARRIGTFEAAYQERISVLDRATAVSRPAFAEAVRKFKNNPTAATNKVARDALWVLSQHATREAFKNDPALVYDYSLSLSNTVYKDDHYSNDKTGLYLSSLLPHSFTIRKAIDCSFKAEESMRQHITSSIVGTVDSLANESMDTLSKYRLDKIQGTAWENTGRVVSGIQHEISNFAKALKEAVSKNGYLK